MWRTVSSRDRQPRLLAAIGVAAVILAGVTWSGAPAEAQASSEAPVWSPARHIDSHDDSGSGLTAVSCPTLHFCAAVDGAGYVLTFDGRQWSHPRYLDGDPYGLDTVSCAGPHMCVAVDTESDLYRWTGTRWRGPHDIDPGSSEQNVTNVSCPTPSFCAVVDTDGSRTVLKDGTWHRRTSSDDYHGVDCASASFCVAVDQNGDASRWDGERWRNPTRADPDQQPLEAVSCSSAHFCLAGGSDLVVDRKGHWSTTPDPSPSTTASVTCPASGFCLVSSTNGNDVDRWNGTRVKAQHLFADESVEVSCVDPASCVAVGNAGNAHYFSVPPAVATRHLRTATRAIAYHLRLRATSGRAPYRWILTRGRLPRGLHLSPTGVIAGTPRNSGTFRLTVRVTDGLDQRGSKAFKLRVKGSSG